MKAAPHLAWWQALLLCVASALLALSLDRLLEGKSAEGRALQSLEHRAPPEVVLAAAATSSAASLRARVRPLPGFSTAAELVRPTVVGVQSRLQPSGLERLWRSSEATRSSSASGVIVHPDGYIVTNNHVLDEDANVEVALLDGRSFEAELIGRDPATDLAVIKIEVAEQLPAVQMGSADSARIGDWVLAVGNPFDLSSTVTAGVLSAKGRSLDVFAAGGLEKRLLQTDAAVNPGNSGGALVDDEGRLIGINTAIMTSSGGYEGYSFAIPVDLVRQSVADIISYGEAHRPQRYVQVPDSSTKDSVQHASRVSLTNKTAVPLRAAISVSSEGRDLLEELGLRLRSLDDAELRRLFRRGVRVERIAKHSPAAESRMGDEYVITHVNRRPVEHPWQVKEILQELPDEEAILFAGFYEHYVGEYVYTFRR